MASFEAVLTDGSVEIIEGADTYEQEGSMTTFFSTGSDREVIDCWSTRLASIRTADLRLVKRCTERVARLAAV